jgi:hypothetical protein
MPRACRLLSLILVLAAAPALGDDSTMKTFNEPKVLDTPQATGRACAVLEQQFDGLIGSHGNKAKAIPARDLRRSGEQKCNTGDYDGGVTDLVKALHDIHVKPEMP